MLQWAGALPHGTWGPAEADLWSHRRGWGLKGVSVGGGGANRQVRLASGVHPTDRVSLEPPKKGGAPDGVRITGPASGWRSRPCTWVAAPLLFPGARRMQQSKGGGVKAMTDKIKTIRTAEEANSIMERVNSGGGVTWRGG
jgi:hypothetical protein